MTMSDCSDEGECPLCCSALDITDRSIQYCACEYRICLWCYHRILEDAAKENMAAKCPNCRTAYNPERIRTQEIDPEQLEELKRKKKERKGTGSIVKARQHLMNVRVVQPNLVYVVGLAMDICYEEVLREPEWFSQFGKIVKVSVNRTNPYTGPNARNGPTGSAYVTFKRAEDAARCIKSIDGVAWKGRAIKACFGTTKYCNTWLRGQVCTNPECMYLHEVADEESSFTKDDITGGLLLPSKFAACQSSLGKPRVPAFSNGLSNGHAPLGTSDAAPTTSYLPVCSASGPAGQISTAPKVVTIARNHSAVVRAQPLAGDSGPSTAGQHEDGHDGDHLPQQSWPGLTSSSSLSRAGLSKPPPGPTWASISATHPPAAAAAVTQPPLAGPTSNVPAAPPPVTDEEWPELGGSLSASSSGMFTSAGHVAGGREAERTGSALPSPVGLPRASSSDTMAVQLTKAMSGSQDRKGAAASSSGSQANPAPAKKLLPLTSPGKLKPTARTLSNPLLRSPSLTTHQEASPSKTVPEEAPSTQARSLNSALNGMASPRGSQGNGHAAAARGMPSDDRPAPAAIRLQPAGPFSASVPPATARGPPPGFQAAPSTSASSRKAPPPGFSMGGSALVGPYVPPARDDAMPDWSADLRARDGGGAAAQVMPPSMRTRSRFQFAREASEEEARRGSAHGSAGVSLAGPQHQAQFGYQPPQQHSRLLGPQSDLGHMSQPLAPPAHAHGNGPANGGRGSSHGPAGATPSYKPRPAPYNPLQATGRNNSFPSQPQPTQEAGLAPGLALLRQLQSAAGSQAQLPSDSAAGFIKDPAVRAAVPARTGSQSISALGLTGVHDQMAFRPHAGMPPPGFNSSLGAHS